MIPGALSTLNKEHLRFVPNRWISSTSLQCLNSTTASSVDHCTVSPAVFSNPVPRVYMPVPVPRIPFFASPLYHEKTMSLNDVSHFTHWSLLRHPFLLLVWSRVFPILCGHQYQYHHSTGGRGCHTYECSGNALRGHAGFCAVVSVTQKGSAPRCRS